MGVDVVEISVVNGNEGHLISIGDLWSFQLHYK